MHTAINLLRNLPIQTQEHLNQLTNELKLRVKNLQRSIELLIKEIELNINKTVFSFLIQDVKLSNQDCYPICFDAPVINAKFHQDKYLNISGWCFSNCGEKVKKIKICRSSYIVLATLPVRNYRHDVGKVYPQCKHLDVGFNGAIKAANLLADDKQYTNVKLKELVYVSSPRTRCLCSGYWIFDYLRQFWANSNDYSKPKNKFRKIYISREKTWKRNILNEDDVWSFLDSFGFEKIIAEEKSISEIAQIFYEASHIVGPHGTGFTNIIFCQKNTRVMEFYSEHITNDYRNICHQLGFKYYSYFK
ncbi:MAG: glycosyltransferase family 61 protein [Trichodesmium sp. MAG_R03]|nr:glycosyltransferase family 61 protein [Trichodesmium sp. MAG_R03]